MKQFKRSIQRKLKHASIRLNQQFEDAYIPAPSENVVFKELADGPVKFNIFIPSLDKKVIFGGIFTALAFIKEVNDLGYPITITTFDYSLSVKEKEEAIALLSGQLNFPLQPEDIQVIGEFKHSTPGKNDIFIATMYYTALFIQSVLSNNAFAQKQFIYFIQDFTPGFTPWSDEYAKALVSFKAENFYPVFNSSLLRDFFIKHDYINKNQSFAFKPQLQLHRLKPRASKNPIPKLIFYARPKRPRNLYEVGLQGLIDWLHEFKPEVEIFTAGQPHEEIKFEKWSIRSLGKMDAEKYWATLNQYDIGLSLMLSPHPSYPPLEMAASGLITVTNNFANKDLSILSDNFVTCEPSAEYIKLALQKAYQKCNDMDARIKGATYDVDENAEELSTVVKSVVALFNPGTS